MRILQSAGVVAITYELIHDTRIIPIGTARKDRLPDAIEYACHEGNYGLHHMLSTSRLYDR